MHADTCLSLPCHAGLSDAGGRAGGRGSQPIWRLTHLGTLRHPFRQPVSSARAGIDARYHAMPAASRSGSVSRRQGQAGARLPRGAEPEDHPSREVESDELLAVKPDRTRAEYCWTLTPYTPKLVFDRAPDAQRVTYVDSDVFLLQSPRAIFEEFERSGKAVMITDHAYDAEYDHTAVVGQYCVQFMTFVRGSSEPVRRWWQDRCVEWCFATPQDGKLGDQKYLDDWPTRFGPLVHVLQQIDLCSRRGMPVASRTLARSHGISRVCAC